MLIGWLRKDYEVKKKGEPTFKRLVEALEENQVGIASDIRDFFRKK